MYADHILFIESSWAVAGVIKSFGVLYSMRTFVESRNSLGKRERFADLRVGHFLLDSLSLTKERLVGPWRRVVSVPLYPRPSLASSPEIRHNDE